MPILNAKIILVGVALFAAPAMASEAEDVSTVNAMINLVAIEQVCGFKIPVDAAYRLVEKISPRLPAGSGKEFGERVRQSGILRGQEVLNSGAADEFCFKAMQIYRKNGY